MAALILAIENPTAAERRGENFGFSHRSMLRAQSPIRSANDSSAGDDGDFLLTLLSRARLMIDRIAAERRAANAARNWVETRRQLARLPPMVRDDLLHAEQSVIGAPDKDVAMERQLITAGDAKHQTYSFD
jgi:hypothetical protein